MEFFKTNLNVNFLGLRKYTVVLSSLAVLISIGIFLVKGLNYGIEFTGGAQVEAMFNAPVDLKVVSKLLQDNGYPGTKLQYIGSPVDVLIRFHEGKISEQSLLKLAQVLHTHHGIIKKTEYVGSEVGHKLADEGAVAVLVAILATMMYIAIRFEYRLAISAALGLTHDALIILGVFSFLQIEFDLATLASILAVIGYSLNDTIVVFDRLRENFKSMKNYTSEEIVNISLNQTLSRTIMTSFLTLLVVIALLLFGGESLFGFSLALFIGITVGTYSSIYVASAIALKLGLSRADMLSSHNIVDKLP
jgi:preprotein translocase subunit SecF